MAEAERQAPLRQQSTASSDSATTRSYGAAGRAASAIKACAISLLRRCAKRSQPCNHQVQCKRCVWHHVAPFHHVRGSVQRSAPDCIHNTSFHIHCAEWHLRSRHGGGQHAGVCGAAPEWRHRHHGGPPAGWQHQDVALLRWVACISVSMRMRQMLMQSTVLRICMQTSG